jgi:hypothetical protein
MSTTFDVQVPSLRTYGRSKNIANERLQAEGENSESTGAPNESANHLSDPENVHGRIKQPSESVHDECVVASSVSPRHMNEHKSVLEATDLHRVGHLTGFPSSATFVDAHREPEPKVTEKLRLQVPTLHATSKISVYRVSGGRGCHKGYVAAVYIGIVLYKTGNAFNWSHRTRARDER